VLVHVAHVFALEEATKAHQMLSSGLRGKVLLVV
jgi:hypothetical protein